jgi:hypothetical protein
MKNVWTKDQRKAVEALLTSLVEPDRWTQRRDADLHDRIDILERALEVLRFEIGHPENNLPLKDFLQGRFWVDRGRMRFRTPRLRVDLETFMSPTDLQPLLLQYLLLSHGSRRTILSCIREFLHHIRPQLTILDFERTQTGVTRCFTNTRLAARTLRDMGFLKYGTQQAYKTWELTLLGLVVASGVLMDGDDPGDEPAVLWKVHPRIEVAWARVATYPTFVHWLTRLCAPNCQVFGTFKATLEEADRLLTDYKKLPFGWRAQPPAGTRLKQPFHGARRQPAGGVTSTANDKATGRVGEDPEVRPAETGRSGG